MKRKLSCLLFLMLLLGILTACSSKRAESSGERITVASTDDRLYLVNAPTEEYIIGRLLETPNITEVTAVTAENDPNGKLDTAGGYYSAVFFSVDLINQDDVFGDSLIDKGTDAGGCVEAYKTAEDAEKRNEYLASFDNNVLFKAGYHTIAGTLVIRTSQELSDNDQALLEANIIETLLGEKIDEPIPTTQQEVSDSDFSLEESSDSMINLPADHSGNLEYYMSLAGEDLEDQILEVTGIYTGKSLGIYDIGDSSDNFYVCFSFEKKTDEIKALSEGDIITVKGKCISSSDNCYQLYGAVLINTMPGDPDYDKPKEEDVEYFGDIEYFRLIESSVLDGKIIEVSGEYTDKFITNYYLGNFSGFHFIVTFDEKTEQIEELTLGNYVTARGKCKIDGNTFYLNDAILIDVQESKPAVRKVYAPISDSGYVGMSFWEVVDLFTNAGFTDITTQEQEVDYNPDIVYESGYVELVTIGGEYFFEKYASFDATVPVIITYVTYAESISPPSSQTAETERPVTEQEEYVEMVWIPQSGSKYHSRKGCSGMNNPTEVTKEEAIAMGYTACKRCY